MPVETLRIGDRVLTRDHGYQTLRWVGRRDLAATALAAQPRLRPILIRRGALGRGLPERDMRLSPQHRILLTGARAELLSGEPEVLSPALYFLGRSGIAQDRAAGGTSYLHLLFDRHEIILSDGVWTESFQPAQPTLGAIGSAQRREILDLFPALSSPAPGLYPAARSTLKRHEARLILAS